MEQQMCYYLGMQKYQFVGKVLPSIQKNILVKVPIGDRKNTFSGEMLFKCTESIVQIEITLTTHSSSIGNLKNSVQYQANLIIDAYSYQDGVFREVMLEKCAQEEQPYNFNPFSLNKENYKKTNFEPKEILKLFHKSPQLADALANFRKAIRYPENRVMFCGIAIESIRQYYAKNGENRNVSWNSMRKSLGISEEAAKYITNYAIPVRHGEMPDLTNDINERIVQDTITIIDAFITYLLNI